MESKDAMCFNDDVRDDRGFETGKKEKAREFAFLKLYERRQP
jgi:hypothetical protein